MKGTLVKRGGRYSVVVELDRDPVTGRRRREWHSGYGTKRDAEAARVEILSRVQRNEYVSPSSVTLAAFLEAEWLPAIRASVRPSTFTSYELNCRRVTERLGTTPLQRLTPAALNALYGELGESLSPRTTRYVHTVLRRALADGVKWGRLVRNPADAATPPSAKAAKAPPPKTWSASELRAFLDSVRGDRLHPLWMLYATAGLRRGEAVGLKWPDVDLEGARLAVRSTRIAVGHEIIDSTPKSGRGRAVELDAKTVTTLKEHRKRQAAEQLAFGPGYRSDGYVFCREDGVALRPDHVSKAFQDAIKRAELPRIRLHDLRHTWASLALSAGVSPKVVSERLGHASVSFTLDVYSHVMPGLQEDAAAKVAALLE